MSKKYALIIGNTEYSDLGLAQLTAPGKDAEDFGRILESKDICGFDEVKISLNQPSVSVIESIDEFFDQKKPDDMLVLYFSGHGVKDESGSLYLAFKNTVRSRLRSTAIKSDYIREAMEQSRSKRQVLILDCCNSGAFPQGTKAETGGTMGLTQAFQGYGRFVLTASDSTQFAWEGDKVIGETNNSLFTHFLVKGLEGEADSDGDGRITVDELYDYAYAQVSKVTPKQTPTKSSSRQEGEIVLRENMSIEDIKPVPLPTPLLDSIENPFPDVRLGAVQQLTKLLNGKNLGLARSAKETLERVAENDDSRQVSRAAFQALETIQQAEQKVNEERKAKEEAERLAHDKAEAERKAYEEDLKLARTKAEQEALQLKAESEKAELATRQAAEKVVKEKVEREAAKMAENEARKIAALKKPEQVTDEQHVSTPSLKIVSRKQPILKWAIIVIIGLCIVGTGAGVISYFASLGGAATPAAAAPTQTSLVDAQTIIPTPVSNDITCAPKGTTPISFPTDGKSITGAWLTEPDNIVPYFAEAYSSRWITQLTLIGLGEWNDQGVFVPELAAEVPTVENGGISPDGLTITWKLRSCIFWSDGEPFTSADVKFTWEALMNSANTPFSRDGYDKIASINTPDETTVVIKFSELYPPWQTLFTQGPYNSGSILPKHILEGKTALESNSFIHNPTIASGPFVITEWIAGDHITLLPNPNFYSGPAILDRIQIKFVSDPETAITALQSGDVDWYPEFSETDITTIDALEPAIHLKVIPGANFEHYFFNLGTTEGVDGQGKADVNGFCPFKDVRVRKAITLGINRQTIVNNFFSGKTTIPATQWPNSEWTNTSLTPDAYNPSVAEALLDEAGYTMGPDGIRSGLCNGVNTKLSFNFNTTTRQLRVDIALAVQSDLAKIGVEFKPNHLSAGTFFSSYTDGGPLYTGAYDMAGYTTGFYPDPMTGVINYFACNSVPSKSNPSGSNSYMLCDPQLDTLIASVNTSADPTVRRTRLDAVQKYIFDQYYLIMIYSRASVYGYADQFVPGPFGFMSDMNWNAEVWDIK